jgi:predicted nucleotidyltransferase
VAQLSAFRLTDFAGGQARGAASSWSRFSMRLSAHDRAAILSATAEVADPDARVLLFGSRTRDDLRGGDIDLLVELPRATPDRPQMAIRLGTRIERRIDILVADPHTPESPMLAAARRQGVVL